MFRRGSRWHSGPYVGTRPASVQCSVSLGFLFRHCFHCWLTPRQGVTRFREVDMLQKELANVS